ncbi:MAG: CopG family transcriptional regulator [Chloroflexota bacterium]|nr:CopG family transcriptional regulator [Chloroflexota bacterium]
MAKRATVYFEEDIHKALRLKAAETDTNISQYVNNAVREALADDEEDLAAFRERADEPTRPFEEYLAELKQRGEL